MPAKGWIEVSDTYCKGCELCLSACPQEVMELDMTRLTPKGYHPAHTFKDGCTGCAICALVCPDAAITVYREITRTAAHVAALTAPLRKRGERRIFLLSSSEILATFAVTKHGELHDT